MEIHYSYESRGGYPYQDTGLGNNLSRHHIIAYPDMYAIGAIVLAYFRILDMEYANYKVKDFYLSNDYRKFETYYRTIYYDANGDRRESGIARNEMNNVMEPLRAQQEWFADTRINLFDSWAQGVLNKLAWTRNNLFIGPTAKFRCDDPEQKCDSLPLSMRNTDFVKWVYEAVYNRYIRAGQEIAKAAGGRGCIILEKDMIKTIGHEFINRLPNMPREHKTKVGDWKAVCSDEQRNRTGSNEKYSIYFERNTRKYAERYQEIKRWKLELCKASVPASGPVMATGTKTVALFGMERKGKDTYLKGIIGGNGPERETQQERDIIGMMRDMPWLA